MEIFVVCVYIGVDFLHPVLLQSPHFVLSFTDFNPGLTGVGMCMTSCNIQLSVILSRDTAVGSLF